MIAYSSPSEERRWRQLLRQRDITVSPLCRRPPDAAAATLRVDHAIAKPRHVRRRRRPPLSTTVQRPRPGFSTAHSSQLVVFSSYGAATHEP